MHVHVTRRWKVPAPTPGLENGSLGELVGDWGLRAWSLEDEVREDPNPSTPANEGKVFGRTAVPAGTYRLYLAPSPHFKRELPHLKDVPGFTDVMIHGGNAPKDTLGCILAGRRRDPFGDCAGVVAEIVSTLRLAEQRGEEASITIEDAFEDPPISPPGGAIGAT